MIASISGVVAPAGETRIAEIWQEVDSDGSGNIDYTEFLAATLDKRQAQREPTSAGIFVRCRFASPEGCGAMVWENIGQKRNCFGCVPRGNS